MLISSPDLTVRSVSHASKVSGKLVPGGTNHVGATRDGATVPSHGHLNEQYGNQKGDDDYVMRL